MESATLDIGKDPADQDFQERQFDLVIATNVIPKTTSLNKSLRHAHKLLAPGGRLLLQQLREGVAWIQYIIGILPMWWCGAEDDRSDEPYVSSSRWEMELNSVGFQSIVLDPPEPSCLSTVVVARLRLENIR